MIVVVAVVTLAAVVEVVAVHYSFVQFYRNQSCTWCGIQNSAMEYFLSLAGVSSLPAPYWAPDSS